MTPATGRLVLVRHGPVAPDPTTPPARWPLTAAGREAVRDLAADLADQGIARIVASPELKAFETAAILSRCLQIPLVQDERLRELAMRTGFLAQDEFRQRVVGYLSGGPDPDFESLGVARARALSVVEDLGGSADSVALVSHGRLLTVLSQALVPALNPVHVWESMRFPDWAVIDLRSRLSLRPFGRSTIPKPR